MAYLSGTASSLSDLKTALESACVANGWALSAGILSKNGCFVKLTATESMPTKPREQFKLMAHAGTGQAGSDLTGATVENLRSSITSFGNATNLSKMSFPVSYEIYINAIPDEVHLIVNYNSDFYQFLAFGKSDIPGVGGSGMWLTGTSYDAYYNQDDSRVGKVFLSFSHSQITTVTSSSTGGVQLPYWISSANTSDGEDSKGGCINVGLDGVKWRSHSPTMTSRIFGASGISALIASIPSSLNQAAVLLPVRIFAMRPSNGVTIVANLRMCRFTRNDNIRPGEIIQYGADKWKVYPLYRKNSALRNGSIWMAGGDYASGTFAIAFKYEGA